MARQRKEPRKAKDIKLRQPDRSAPTEKTLLQLAEDRNLFDLADKHQRRNKAKDGHDEEEEDDGSEDDVAEDQSGDDVLSSSADRLMDTLLYSVCLAMLHFTLDFLVQHQYAMKMDYGQITLRAIQSLVVFAALVHVLHPHPANTTFIPGVPEKYHYGLRQIVFFVTSVAAGCYLIYISNRYSYLAVLKQSPPLACLWIWSVLEMNLGFSIFSLALAYFFFWYNGYRI